MKFKIRLRHKNDRAPIHLPELVRGHFSYTTIKDYSSANLRLPKTT